MYLGSSFQKAQSVASSSIALGLSEDEIQGRGRAAISSWQPGGERERDGGGWEGSPRTRYSRGPASSYLAHLLRSPSPPCSQSTSQWVDPPREAGVLTIQSAPKAPAPDTGAPSLHHASSWGTLQVPPLQRLSSQGDSRFCSQAVTSASLEGGLAGGRSA